MSFDSAFTVYFDLHTTAGHRVLAYTPDDQSALGAGEYVYFGLGAETANGTWTLVARDLEADLNTAQPGVQVLDVNAILVRGSGRLDDIALWD